MRALVAAALLLTACGDDDGGARPADDAGPLADTGPRPDAPGTPDAGPPISGDAGPVITPDDPGPSDVRFDVHTGQDVHAISPYIYGTNQPEWSGSARGLAFARAGGNRWTAYNWENNASNAGSDYMFQNDGFLGGGDTPAEAVRGDMAEAHAAGAAYLVTVPIAGYVSADKDGGGDVRASGPGYLTTRFRESRPAKGAPLTTMPDTSDAFVYQDEYVSFIEGVRGGGTVMYSLDNEPDLWASTHAEIHPDPVTYEQLVTRNVEYATAIKAVAPDARVFGFVSYGWHGYTTLQDAPDAMGRDFIEHWLDRMAAAEATAGRRVVDVLDLHWYPEAQGGGRRITNDDVDDTIATARMQAPRSLWDPSYTEESWITGCCSDGPIRLIPRLREKIAAHYPGTLLAFTEYNYGGGDHISGGIAQADVLGIFGREDVFAAALWHLSDRNAYFYGAFRLYRDYDGAGGRFGDVSVRATTDDVARTSVYASLDPARPGVVVMVAINKSDVTLALGIAITHTTRLTTAETYVLAPISPTPTRGPDLPITATNAFVYSAPARTVTTLVLRPD